MAAYLDYTLRMKMLFRGWTVMVHDMHMRRSTRMGENLWTGKPSPYVTSQLSRLSPLPSMERWNEYQLLGWVIIINGDSGCKLWQPVQDDSRPHSSALVFGWRPLRAVLHSSNKPGELSQWLCHDDSTINIVVLIIIIIIMTKISAESCVIIYILLRCNEPTLNYSSKLNYSSGQLLIPVTWPSMGT